jgi:hypothetical protein
LYHPQRLVKKEADGDDHIQLQLESGHAGLLNDKNKTAAAECLVGEPVCENAVTQADAVQACRAFHSSIEVPDGHPHVKVLGSYVLDSELGHGWMEIHPVATLLKE